MGKDKASLIVNVLILIALIYIGLKLNRIAELLQDVVMQGHP